MGRRGRRGWGTLCVNNGESCCGKNMGPSLDASHNVSEKHSGSGLISE